MSIKLSGLRAKFFLVWGGGCLFLLAAILAILPESGRSNPAPALSIALSGSNTLLLTVTNGTNTVAYEIFTKSELNTNLWTLAMSGALGVTNFSTNMYPALTGFFKARASNDWDNDGVLNSQDANPNSTNIGILTITIETPLNGSTLH